jgi:hypothetical protein
MQLSCIGGFDLVPTDEQQPHLSRIPHRPTVSQTSHDRHIRSFQSPFRLPDLECEWNMVGDEPKSSERCKETRLRFFLLSLELGTFGRSGGFCGSDGW